MSDITINNEESQNKNQKTTPVTRSLDGRKQLDSATTNAILQIWQGQQDSNLRHLVLETSALPTELCPFMHEIHYTISLP